MCVCGGGGRRVLRAPWSSRKTLTLRKNKIYDECIQPRVLLLLLLFFYCYYYYYVIVIIIFLVL